VLRRRQNGEQRCRTAQQGVTVRRSACYRLPGNQPAGTRPGLNQNLLPPSDRELLADRARRNVERATGRHRQHDLDGLVRIPVLCQRGGGTDRDSSKTGHFEGQNVTVEYHWLDGHYDRLPSLMAELVRRRVTVICTPASNPAAAAAKAATTTIPIVFGSALIRSSLVSSPASRGRAAMQPASTFSWLKLWLNG